MATYTKEQNELVAELRKLAIREQEGKIGYEEALYYVSLQEQANTQNLCWW